MNRRLRAISFSAIALLVSLIAGCGGSDGEFDPSPYQGRLVGYFDDDNGTIQVADLTVDAEGNLSGTVTEDGGTTKLQVLGRVSNSGTMNMAVPGGSSVGDYTGSVDLAANGVLVSGALAGSGGNTLYAGLSLNVADPGAGGNAFAGNYVGSLGSFGLALNIDESGTVSGSTVLPSGSSFRVAEITGLISGSGAFNGRALVDGAVVELYAGTFTSSATGMTATIATNSSGPAPASVAILH